MRAYERLLKYVKVWTTSDPESGTHPSTMRQFDLAHQLVQELKDLGLTDAHVDEHCYVYATLPATPGQESAKPLGFIAHMDTADDASGENVNPQIHPNYDGGKVVLPATGTVLDPAQFPFLTEMKGQTLITTDGSTLLGADDKAGVSEIMTMLERVISEKRPHGKLCIGFTPDEEIGEGACLNERYGEGTVGLDIHDSYHNMLEKIQPHFHLVENARKAIRAAGLEPIETPVRGGTDGATLSYMGLPCPNLGTGGFNFHGPCECITAEKMDQCTEILLNLVDLYK